MTIRYALILLIITIQFITILCLTWEEPKPTRPKPPTVTKPILKPSPPIDEDQTCIAWRNHCWRHNA